MTRTSQHDPLAEATSGSLDPELPAVEALYLHDVGTLLADLGRRDRRALLGVVRDHLSDRPPAAHRAELLEAIGAPSDYAKRLRAEHGFPDRVGLLTRVRQWPRLAKAAAGLAVVVIVAAIGSYSWWAGQEAEFGDSCAGYDPSEGIERLEAAGVSEARVPHRDGEELRVALCLHTDRNVTVTDIRLPFEGDFVRLAGVEVDPTGEGRHEPVHAFEPLRLAVRSSNPTFWLVLAFGDCRAWDPGAGIGIDRLLVNYELLGRTRSAEVPLAELVTVVASGPPRCP